MNLFKVDYRIRSTVSFLVFASFVSIILGYVLEIEGLVEFGKPMLGISIVIWLIFSFINIEKKKRKSGKRKRQF